ncbi:hypothetical protein FBUS_01768 [Fasciolopsis buskii]|uniref:Uncharacterized protein n=1 Tax=Fasciolopsis buskii TaxID=27845 RepID=A0A8E0RT35_9TREM|nr:hypothetical protein FBUS_01768 [Fasciolopsis buski]
MVVLLPIYGAAQSRTQRCRLEDLCPEDRGKLARLVMELALAQEAVGKQSPMGSSAKPVWNVENDSFGDAIKNRQVSAQSDSSSASKAQTLHNKPPEYSHEAQLTHIESELRRLRVLVAGHGDHCSSISQSGLITALAESTPVGGASGDPKQAVQSELPNQVENTVKQPWPVSKQKRLQVIEDSDPQEEREIRRKLIQHKEILQRQRQVLCVVADQQTKIERLETEMQHVAQLLARALQQSLNQPAKNSIMSTSNRAKHSLVVTDIEPISIPVWQPLEVHTTASTPSRYSKLVRCEEPHREKMEHPGDHHQGDGFLDITVVHPEEQLSNCKNGSLVVKGRVLNHSESTESLPTLLQATDTHKKNLTGSDAVRVPEVVSSQTQSKTQPKAKSRRSTRQYWSQTQSSFWTRGEPCGQSEGPTTPSGNKHCTVEQDITTISIPTNPGLRDAQTSTPSCLSTGQEDQAVQCQGCSSASADVQTSTEQPLVGVMNREEWTNSTEELNHVLDLISELNHFRTPNHQMSSCMLTTTSRLAHSGSAKGISPHRMEEIQSWLESTTPIVSAAEQELLNDLFFQTH